MEEEELQALAERDPPQTVQEVPSLGPPPEQRSGALDDANRDLMGHAPGAHLTNAQLAHAAVLEQMAHDGAYRGTHTGDNVAEGEEGDRDLNPMLRANGYQTDPQLIRGANGLEMVVYRPEPGSNAAPVVAFRGSLQSRDVRTDTDLDQVGDLQYESNRDLIDRTMAQLSTQYPDNRPELTGHSLGGALAQRTAADHLDQSGHITTFSAPGINTDQVERIEAYNLEHPDRPITADHFRAEGDVVPSSGEGHAPGTVHTTAIAPPEAEITGALGAAVDVPDRLVRGHTAYIATPYALQTEEGRQALPHLVDENGNVSEDVRDDYYVRGGLDSEEVDENWYDPGRLAAETGRRFVGANVELADMIGATDAARDIGNQSVANIDDAVTVADVSLLAAQTGVNIASEAGNAAVDDTQARVSGLADDAHSRVNRVQNVANVVNDVGQRTTDAVQNDVNSGVRDVVGDRAANVLLGNSNLVVDTAQDLTRTGVNTANTAVDVGQQLARNTANVANDAVDSGQNAARSVVRTGQSAVEVGRSAVRSGQEGVHDVWNWMTE